MSNRTARIIEYCMLGVVVVAWAWFVVSSNASGVAKVFMGLGFALALMLLMTMRELKLHAVISRFAAIGEPDKIIELADEQLARRRDPKRRVPFQVFKAIGESMKGEWEAAIATLEAIDFERMRGSARRTWQFLYYNNLLACYCFVDRVPDARKMFDDHIEPFGSIVRSAGTTLAVDESRAKLLYFEGDLEAARKGFELLVDDVRLASAARALYHYFLGRILHEQGEINEAKEHFSEATDLAPNTFIPAYVDALMSGS